MKITDIRQNEKNPRKISDEKLNELKRSISSFEKMMHLRPIIVDSDGVILGGNMRYRALVELGYDEIPDAWVVYANELSDEEKKEFVIKDNIGFGDWDWGVLKSEWDEDKLIEWGLEIEDYVNDDESVIDDDFDDAYEIHTTIVSGDIIEIGQHRLICGDSLDPDNIVRLMLGRKAAIVFTDPDYSMDEQSVIDCYKNTLIAMPACSFWICSDKQAVSLASFYKDQFTHFFVHDFKIPTLISNTQPMQVHNVICKFGNKKMNNLNDGFKTIVSVASERTLDVHKSTPMSKRVELPGAFISHYTDKGDIVLDIFAHSGSTIIAAEQLGRVCYAVEIEPKFCQFIIDRMIQMNNGIEVKINGKKYEKIEKAG